MNKISLSDLELVIFDVDGTLYNQNYLRRKMCLSLIFYYIIRPWKIRDLIILYHFRKEREKRAGFEGENLSEQQYQWCQQKVNQPVEKIKRIVNKWIFEFPNKYLKECTYPGIHKLFEVLAEKNILIAIYSDYDSKKKMKCMELSSDLYVSSTDSNINAFKPKPNGLNFICSTFGIVDRSKCLFIGDRQELDGECARAGNIPFLLINKKKIRNNFFYTLSKQML